MRKFIVITTIHPLSPGVTRFAEFPGWHILLVGDKKSAPIQSTPNLTYLSIEDQLNLRSAYSLLCPYNHYARKNIGYLYAMQQGAELIYDTDDDNLPYGNWGFPGFVHRGDTISGARYVNVYRYFTNRTPIWPRGFPLSQIHEPIDTHTIRRGRPVEIGVWQGLADLAPDVDAIYRLIFPGEVRFDKRPAVALAAGSYCPFNSQNTLWRRELFALLYLPATATFRFTDVLRSYIAQSLMWRYNFHVGFTEASVFQVRNAHNLLEDFAQEVKGYLDIEQIVELISGYVSSGDLLQDIENVYELLVEHGHLAQEEMTWVQAWAADIRSIGL